MRAFVLRGFGGPEMLEFCPDWPEPHPAPGEVRIRVAATGINNTDIWTREGAYGSDRDPTSIAGPRREALEFPRIQGADVVGYVDEIGENVSSDRLGQRVIVNPFLYSEGDFADNPFLGSERDGGFADHMTIPSVNAIPIHSSLTDHELATFPSAYGTALHMLNRGRVSAGETVLVTGASGGVGSALVQLLKARGCRVVALVSAGKEDRLRALGADDVLTRQPRADLADLVRAEVSGTVDVVADVVGGVVTGQALGVLRPEGRYVVSGAISGPIADIDLRTVYLKHLDLVGSSLCTHQEFHGLVAMVESGVLTPVLAATFSLEDLPRAQEMFRAKQFVGKIVVSLADWEASAT
jgi:NADPH:quinone reductase-like Zn-dependent oxidoreductase